MVYIGNLVDGVIDAQLEPCAAGQAYWIADRRPYEMAEIISTARRAMADEGLEVRGCVPRLPRALAQTAERADGIIQRLGFYSQSLHVLGEMDKTIACDVSRSELELGYVPRVSLYTGLRLSVRWCRDNGIAL